MADKNDSPVDWIEGVLAGFERPAAAVGTDYRILGANRAYREMYAHGSEVIGRTCHSVSHGSSVPCDRAGEDCPMRNARLSHQPSRVLHIHHTPRGDEHVDVEMRPVFDNAGQLRFFFELVGQAPAAVATALETGMVGRAPAFTRMLELVQRVAPTEAAALLLGESGTGKELVAQAIHEASSRSAHAFVPVECSGLTESLFESELFGHEKGAFTGASVAKPGLVEAARGGTLFLDEVGDIPLSLQVKLLRLLETASYRRVGSVVPQQADFRLICATHRSLEDMVERGEFRADLFYRINSFPIELPPLRERRSDLPLLVDTFLQRLPLCQGKRVAPEAMACLERYAFPGNVRELRNILERGCLLADGDLVLAKHLPRACRERGVATATPASAHDSILPLAEIERRYLQDVAARFTGSRGELARRLGISERTLFRKLKAMG